MEPPKIKRTWVKCYKCGYEWVTASRRTYWLRCPNCLRDIRRDEAERYVMEAGKNEPTKQKTHKN